MLNGVSLPASVKTVLPSQAKLVSRNRGLSLTLDPSDLFLAISPHSQISTINFVRTMLLLLMAVLTKMTKKKIQVVINQVNPLSNPVRFNLK